MVERASGLTLVAALVLAAAPLAAQETPPAAAAAPVAPTVRRVSLFKNGLAFVELEVAAPAGDGWLQVVPPSLPLHGSFWVASDPSELTVREAVAERVKIKESVAADSIPALLRANIGKAVTLRAGGIEFSGTLLAYPGTEDAPAAPPAPAAAAWPGEAPAEPAPGTLVLVKKFAGGTVGLNPAAIENVVIQGDDAAFKYTRTREQNQLRLRLEKATAGKTLAVQYLTYGLAWAPSYRIDLLDEEKARLTARTDILNDVMDLAQVPVVLVSGFPNLRFVHVPGPLGLRGTLDEFVAALAVEPDTGSRRREQVASQQIASNSAFQSEQGLVAVTTQGLAGTAQEDMFFSRLGEVSLNKGGRANFPLFAVEIPCEQVFRWEVEDYLNAHGFYQSREEQKRPEEVWHSLRLTNTTDNPWTTAPVTVLKGGSVLGQDVCFYTPAGGRSLVKVTKALNIRAEEQEHEIDRKRGAERLYGNEYDLVTIEGTLYLCSYKTHDVTVEVSKTFSGEIVEIAKEATLVKLGRGLQQVNQVNRANWRLTLPAGKEARLVYKYKVLVRR